jgi:hypothetical protein
MGVESDVAFFAIGPVVSMMQNVRLMRSARMEQERREMTRHLAIAQSSENLALRMCISNCDRAMQ